jgi:hypothetical protein
MMSIHPMKLTGPALRFFERQRGCSRPGNLSLSLALKKEESMSQEERFSGKRGLQGCLVTWVCMVVFPLLISAVLTSWLGLISIETERVLILLIWLLALCLGGYVAARMGKTTGWTNALVVGLLAEFLVVARLPRGGADKDLFDPFLEMMKDPGANWRPLVQLSLTIPAAILGGVIWEKTGGVQPSGKGQSEAINKSERAEE